MQDIIIFPPYLFVILFFIIAFFYSAIGLGGGSSYTALMVIFAFSSLIIPIVSLSLNLLVSSISSYNFLRNKHGRWHIIMPFIISAIPCAYFAGMLKVEPKIFIWLLFVSLIIIAIRIYFYKDITLKINLSHQSKKKISFVIGAILGFIAGIVGIGGGIYLVPLIIILGIGHEKEAAASAAVFVFMVSLSGLISRLQYNSIDLTNYVTIIIAVALGGFLGSYMGSFKFDARFIEKILGIIIIIAIVLLGKRILI